MAKQEKEITSLTFVGRPFGPTMMNDRTFSKANMQVENESSFQKFLTENKLENKRASMVVFAPENYLYWYGTITADQNLKLPKGLMKFVLPQGKIAFEESKGAATSLDLPLNFMVQHFFNKLIARGIKVYQNPGDSDTPYFIQALDLSTKKLTQFWYLQASR